MTEVTIDDSRIGNITDKVAIVTGLYTPLVMSTLNCPVTFKAEQVG